VVLRPERLRLSGALHHPVRILEHRVVGPFSGQVVRAHALGAAGPVGAPVHRPPGPAAGHGDGHPVGVAARPRPENASSYHASEDDVEALLSVLG
jgi:hypothetical protein